MSLSPEKQARYERFVDATNVLVAELGNFFDNPSFNQPEQAELAHVVLKAREKLEEMFLYFNKGANILHQRSAEHMQAVVDQALKDAESGKAPLRVVDQAPAGKVG